MPRTLRSESLGRLRSFPRAPVVNDRQRADAIIHPDKFSASMLQRRLWQKQKEIVRSVARNPLTAVKGCHASGKTYVASGLPLWWLMRYTEAVAYTLAPTLRQVKTFWGEIALARSGGIRSLQIALPAPTTTRLELSPARYAQGASSSRGVNVQGIHGKNVLLIGDEAPGIGPDIWDAVEGMRAGGNVRMVIQGNPVVPAGYFYDAFGRSRGLFNCISISAFDTPNLQNELTGEPLTIEELCELDAGRLAYCPFPSLVSRAWVRERLKVWGPKHPKYLSRVLAEFPSQSPYSVFELAWIERAKREPTEQELALALRLRIQVGIDVAGPGDDETTLTARVGGIIIRHEAWNDADPRGAVARVLYELSRHPLYRLGLIVVDVTGIGYNFARHLADLFPGLVYGFNAGSLAIDTTQFVNQKAEAYFTTREYFKAGVISGLQDEETEAQLSTMLYRETPRGLTEIRSKDDMRSEFGVPSPDRAESLIMAFMRIVPRTVSRDMTVEAQISPI